MENMNFGRPTQVAFWNEAEECYNSGIAYGDEIICACCGGVLEIVEVIEDAPEGIKPIVVYENWVDFHEEIIGDDELNFECGE